MESLPLLMNGPHWLPWLLAGGLATAWLISLFAWRRATKRFSRAQRKRMRIAQKGESDAERLLEAAGYGIIDRQLTRRWDLRINEQREEVTCRADLLLERGGQFFIADVKTGQSAPDPRKPATRRQLLEYLLAFEVDGALVVDMESRSLREVSFPGLLGWQDDWDDS